MKFVITNKNVLSSSVAAFQRRIASLAQSERSIEWAFPNGEKAVCITYSVATDLGELLVAVPKKWEGRQAHLFALNHAGGTLAPHVEINIPDGLDRRVSGAYVQSGKSALICHRGGFTAYRGKIPKEVSMAYFEKWLISVEDADKEASLISVASLESNSLANDIAEFVSAVTEMKTQFKSGESVSAIGAGAQSSSWRDGAEFEGEKSSGKSAPPKNYEYLHGPLCNALRRQLKRLVEGFPAVEVLSNRNIDVAVVAKNSCIATAIFEVKTSASLSGQLYTAHGQLAYYKRKYGDATTALFLVLPKEAQGQMNSLDFFKDAGIEVIYGDKEAFIATSGRDFSEVVARCVRP
ncbi:hypothetical protein [Achromobacter kerstersii]|uniref:hypothetical protein n=1 Tax=Achromobacter kerstersii TaxID=1353890 RepID=UPI0006C5776D|nr:hypothetical protein [Achromobacter kerstersii]CUI73905.1 Uncharacterised protein [Achromobacter kerstersii]